MIRWCAYCQQYLGEKEPFEDFSITHSICAVCKKDKKAVNDPANLERIAHLVNVQDLLLAAGKSGDLSAAEAAVRQAIQFNFRPIDLLLGLLQPTLYVIGEKWSRREITIADEHRFTTLAASLIPIMGGFYSDLNHLRQTQKPEVLLVNALGNYHVLGIQMVELFLLLNGIGTLSLYPGLPPREVKVLCDSLKPAVVAFSIALPDQMAGVEEFATQLLNVKEGVVPKIAVGGFAVRTGVKTALANLNLCANLSDILTLCGRGQQTAR